MGSSGSRGHNQWIVLAALITLVGFAWMVEARRKQRGDVLARRLPVAGFTESEGAEEEPEYEPDDRLLAREESDGALLDGFLDFMFGEEPSPAQRDFGGEFIKEPPLRKVWSGRPREVKPGRQARQSLLRRARAVPEFEVLGARFRGKPGLEGFWRAPGRSKAVSSGSAPADRAQGGNKPRRRAAPAGPLARAYLTLLKTGAPITPASVSRAALDAGAIPRGPGMRGFTAPPVAAASSSSQTIASSAGGLPGGAAGAITPLAERPAVPFSDMLDPTLFSRTQIEALVSACIDFDRCEFWQACAKAGLRQACEGACAKKPGCQPPPAAAGSSQIAAAPPGGSGGIAPGGNDDGGGASYDDGGGSSNQASSSHYEAICWTDAGGTHLGVIEVNDADNSATYVTGDTSPGDDARYWEPGDSPTGWVSGDNPF